MHGVLDLGLAGPGPETGRQLGSQPALVDVAGPTSMQPPDLDNNKKGAVERGTSQGGDDIGLPILGVGRRDINNKSTHIPEKRFDIVESELGLDRQTPPGRAEAEAR